MTEQARLVKDEALPSPAGAATTSEQQALLHAFARDHSWSPRCIDCRSLVRVQEVLDDTARWVEQFREKNPSDDEDYGYNHAIDDVALALRGRLGNEKPAPVLGRYADGWRRAYWAHREGRHGDECCQDECWPDIASRVLDGLAPKVRAWLDEDADA